MTDEADEARALPARVSLGGWRAASAVAAATEGPEDNPDETEAPMTRALRAAVESARARLALPEPEAPESPRDAAKRLRRRIRRYIEVAFGDTCREGGCRHRPRFWDARCDKHSLARPARGTWVDTETYELLWAAFFKLAGDETLGQPGNDGAQRAGAKLLGGFGSVNWDRFRRGEGAGQDDGDQLDDGVGDE